MLFLYGWRKKKYQPCNIYCSILSVKPSPVSSNLFYSLQIKNSSIRSLFAQVWPHRRHSRRTLQQKTESAGGARGWGGKRRRSHGGRGQTGDGARGGDRNKKTSVPPLTSAHFAQVASAAANMLTRLLHVCQVWTGLLKKPARPSSRLRHQVSKRISVSQLRCSLLWWVTLVWCRTNNPNNPKAMYCPPHVVRLWCLCQWSFSWVWFHFKSLSVVGRFSE